MVKKEVLQKVMLGHNIEQKDIVVVTPLKTTFKNLFKKIKSLTKYEKCFFENFEFEINGNKGLVVLMPQGLASCDIIELFDNTKILFLGMAGSLNPEFEIGDFCEVNEAVCEDGYLAKLSVTNQSKLAKCGYSPCLIGDLEKEYKNLATKYGCDVIDMEISHCSKVAVKNNNKFTALLLISDNPGLKNFWELSSSETEKLSEARQILVDKAIEYIELILAKGN